MKLKINIAEHSYQFVLHNLCSQNGYSDYEGFPDHELSLEMAAVVERVKSIGFRIEGWNDCLCLARDDHKYLTIYPSGRIILERVPGDDPRVALPYFIQVLAARIEPDQIYP